MKSRQTHFFAATLLLLSIIFSENSVAAADVSVEDVDHVVGERNHNDDVASDAADERETINVGSKEKVANNDLEGHSIDDEVEHGRDIPSSIAEATLVGARLRQQLHENDTTDSSHQSDTIDVNLLEWSELPTPMKEAALTLGCNSEMWNSDEESSQCKLFWSELTEEEQKAAMVLGYQSSSWDDDNNGVQDEQELMASEAVDENAEYQNPKAGHITGCHHWGAMGCSKGSATAGSATTVPKINATPGVFDEDDDVDSTVFHQSSLAGSATAKIEAHVMKGAGRTSSPLSAKKDRFQANKVGVDSTASSSNNPPQGFTLSARIVTSPQDGLSYFLDVPDVDVTTMMTIPYTFLDCGRNIESTTEAFSLDDLVVRHLPAGADIGHWVNLGGGVTIDTEDEYEDSSPRYINGNHDGRPKLLVALSPIEIVVSGNDEESRTFNPGEIILMEDTLGKGHKLKANSRGKDLSVIMISLPHTVYIPSVSWSSVQDENNKSPPSPPDSASSWHKGAHQSLFGFAPKNYHPRSKARHTTKPCPLEYDSVYSSLFTPTSNKNLIRQKNRRRYLSRVKRKAFATTADSSDGSSYPPDPGFTTYNDDQSIFKYLPSLRQSMLIGIGLSLTSSFVYCAQLLYPPFLALWGGATVVVLGAVVNVKGLRWLYQQHWMVVWQEERRWKRDLKRHKKRKQEEAAAAAAEKSRGAV